MSKHKLAPLITDDNFIGTSGADTLIARAGDTVTFTGFDPLHDRVMFDVDHGYSDITTLQSITDGTIINLFTGGRIEVHAGDFNGDGIGDTRLDAYGVSGIASVTLLGINPDSLHGWNIAGG